MKVLIASAGVIGTVYSAHLAAAGNNVCVLSHRLRTDEVAVRGLSARDALDGVRTDGGVAVVADASGDYDLVLVTVRRDQLALAGAGLAALAGNPAIIFVGSNPAGHSALPGIRRLQLVIGGPAPRWLKTRSACPR